MRDNTNEKEIDACEKKDCIYSGVKIPVPLLDVIILGCIAVAIILVSVSI